MTTSSTCLIPSNYDTTANCLALEQTLLNHPSSSLYLYIWESKEISVVLGRSKSIDNDVHHPNCLKDNIPIYRRISGGGTVLQGPGCLNFALIGLIDQLPWAQTISSTTQYILDKHQQMLSNHIEGVKMQGQSDLCINHLKFSGHAQRRTHNAFLYHGTFLYDFDLSLMNKYLKNPPIQPDYRQQRGHDRFLTQLTASKEDIHEWLCYTWGAFKDDNFRVFDPKYLPEIVN